MSHGGETNRIELTDRPDERLDHDPNRPAASRTAIDLRARSGSPSAAIPIGVVGDAVRRPEPTV
jgi:hypothetical protein